MTNLIHCCAILADLALSHFLKPISLPLHYLLSNYIFAHSLHLMMTNLTHCYAIDLSHFQHLFQPHRV
ncbi:hypothetical protein Hanom_Chr06g00501791 [Helianthus anomalus]